jgi:hypothetical protein
MALFLRQEDGRSKLQQQIAAELQAKAKAKAEAADLPDGVDDSRYVEHTKKTTSLAWAWLIIAVAVIGLVIGLIVISMPPQA